MRSAILALLSTRCAASSAYTAKTQSTSCEENTLLQSRMVRRAHAHAGADELLATVKQVANSYVEGSSVTMTPHDVNAAMGQANSALENLLPTFSDAHQLAEQELAHALAAVQACHTEHGGDVRVRLENALARDLTTKAQCEDSLEEAVAAEAEACAGQGEVGDCACEEARTVIADQEAVCFAVTTTYERSFCDLQSVCGMLDDCHSREAGVYNVLRADLEAQMIARQQQYITVRQSQCLTDLIMDAMMSGTPINPIAMAGCATVSVDNLEITFPELPPEPAQCDPVGEGDPQCDFAVVFDDANDALSVTPGSLVGAGQLGWNTAANSAREITAQDNICGISFKCNTAAAHLMIGLASNPVARWQDLDYGVTCRGAWHPSTDLYENGAHVHRLSGRANNGDPTNDVHTIRLNQHGQIEYGIDGVVYYTSSRGVSYPWHVGVDTYTAPSLSEVEYLTCRERHLPRLAHGDAVVFEQANAALTVEPGIVTGEGQLGWNTAANSAREVNMQDGICGITFKCNTAAAHLMLGLSSSYVERWQDLDFGVTCRGAWHPVVDLYEGGRHVHRLGGRANNGNPQGDVYAIRINENNVVEYALGGVVYYTSATAVRYPWHVGLDVYTAPSLSEVEYIQCGAPMEQADNGEDVVFDQANAALTVAPGTVTAPGQMGWNTAANSAREITATDGVCGISFKCNTAASHLMLGLSSTFVGRWQDLDYGVTCRGAWHPVTDLYEDGRHVHRLGGRAGNGDPTTDVHSIRINTNGQVEYAVDGSVYFTSSRAVTYPWHVGLDTYTAPSLSEVQYLPC